MQTKTLCLTVVVLSLLSLGGCVAKSDYLQKTAEADALNRDLATMSVRNEALREEIGRLTEQRERLTAEGRELLRKVAARDSQLAAREEERNRTVRTLENRITELEGDKQMLRESIDLLKKRRVEEVHTVSKTYESLLGQMKGEIDQGQIKISELEGKLTVDVVDKILFDSGQAEIKPAGREVLQRVVDILVTVTDKTIRVEGHTDNVPISGSLVKRFPTNWELSAARALTVTRALEKAGLDPALLSAAAYGEHQPVADNATPEGRAKNRRIAIILLPQEQNNAAAAKP